MIIAQISDTHIALDTPDADRRLQDFAATIADINALDPASDVIVHTGDIVHNGRSDEYAQARAVLSDARAPAHVMVGNKDHRVNLRAAFSDAAYLTTNSEFIDYAVEDFPVRLIMLDTLNPESNKGDFCPQRVKNLIEMTDAETAKPIVVFAHHPPFEVKVGPDPINFDPPDTMTALRKALQHSDRVIAVISGHVHRSTTGQVDTIPASVMPSIATTLRKGDYSVDMKTRPVYAIHRYDPKWGISSETRIVGMGS